MAKWISRHLCALPWHPTATALIVPGHLIDSTPINQWVRKEPAVLRDFPVAVYRQAFAINALVRLTDTKENSYRYPHPTAML